MNINNLEFLKQYAVDCYPQEMCGALVNEVFIFLKAKLTLADIPKFL